MKCASEVERYEYFLSTTGRRGLWSAAIEYKLITKM
jgi:hypothetical protein